MATRRKCIKLFEHERPVLVQLYLEWRIPVDQFEGRPNDLDAFVSSWRSLTGRNDTGGDLIHYMRSQRKQGFWPRLDGDHKKVLPQPPFSPEDTEALVAVFEDNLTMLNHCSDAIAYDSEIAELFVKEFFAITGRRVPAHQLITKLTALRKRGSLPKLGKIEKPADAGFDDIDDVAV